VPDTDPEPVTEDSVTLTQAGAPLNIVNPQLVSVFGFIPGPVVAPDAEPSMIAPENAPHVLGT